MTVDDFDLLLAWGRNGIDEGKLIGKGFIADIVVVDCYGVIPFTTYKVDQDAIGNIEALFTDGLDTIDQFAGHTLLLEFRGEGDIERHGKIALVGNDPTGDILSSDLYIAEEDFDWLTLNIEVALTFGLKLVDLLLTEVGDDSADGFHDFTITGTKGFEVGFDAFNQHIIVGIEKLDRLDINLAADKISDRGYLLTDVVAMDGDGDLSQRLTHTEVALFTKT